MAASDALECSIHGVPVLVCPGDLRIDSVFVRSGHPPAVGTRIELLVRHGACCAAELSGKIVHVGPRRPGDAVSGFEVDLADLSAEQAHHLQIILGKLRHIARRDAAPEATTLRTRVESQLASELARMRRSKPHEILGVRAGATGSSVEQAFIDYARKYHPHRYARYESAAITELAMQLFVEVKRAYGVMRQRAGATSSRPAPPARESDEPPTD